MIERRSAVLRIKSEPIDGPEDLPTNSIVLSAIGLLSHLRQLSCELALVSLDQAKRHSALRQTFRKLGLAISSAPNLGRLTFHPLLCVFGTARDEEQGGPVYDLPPLLELCTHILFFRWRFESRAPQELARLVPCART